MARLTPVLRSSVAGVSFTIRSDRPALVAGLCQRWRALPPGPRKPALLFDACFRPHTPRLTLNGRSRCTARNANHLLAELELAIYDELVRRSSKTPLHAAALAFEGEGLLLAGPSGAGKSTLAWGLIQRGAEYLAEEHVFLDEEGGLEGFPRALSFAGPTGDDLGLSWAPRVRHQVPRVRLIALLELPRAGGSRALSPAEAAAGLTQHLHRPPRDADLRRIVQALSGVPAIALCQAGVAGAVNQVLTKLEPRSPVAEAKSR